MNERTIFMATLDKETSEQKSAFLDEACAGDAALRQRIEALLHSHEQAGSFLGQRPSERTVRRELDRLGYAWKRGRYALDPDPELEKKTADPQENPRPAAAPRGAGPRRDRPVAVAVAAGWLGQARTARLTYRSRGGMSGGWSSAP